MREKRIKTLREHMVLEKVDAFIVPSADPHFGEYFQEYYKSREWLSGFTGSAGTLVVTAKEAALWTDSRYFVQGAMELQGTEIALMKMKHEETPSIEEWLKNLLHPSSTVGIDAALVSIMEYNSMLSLLSPLSIKLCQDPFNKVWSNRPPLSYSTPYLLTHEVTGESTSSKFERFKKRVGIKTDFHYILSTCDDIAWICNIRGSDIQYNPLLYSYLIMGKEKMKLFVNLDSVPEEVLSNLQNNDVEVLSYDSFYSALENLDASLPVVAPPSKTSVKVYELVVMQKEEVKFIPDNTPGGVVGALKSVKNGVEIEGFRKAMIDDGVAWVKFWIEMEQLLDEKERVVTESHLAKLLIEKRALSKEYKGESFSPIVAFGANGALPHYSPLDDSGAVIGSNTMLLIDTGAQYLYGTTDTTRTFALGEVSEEAKRDYTMVLRGMIMLSKAMFPKGTRGASLDILARGEVYKRGKLYMHGTGHGIGHHLCVHEGPQSIRMEENPVVFLPGMVTSNEPAIYEPGEYGIRIENLLLCKEHSVTKHAEFYSFETLTLVPIDRSAIVTSMLGEEAIKWLNNYHNEVYNHLAPRLNESEKRWLAKKTSNIGG